MRKSLLTSLCILFSFMLFSQTSGGPDLFGYKWKNSQNINGPNYKWIDLTKFGTRISGLSDDNSIGWVNIGFDFVYYWGKFNKVRIGSNGWLSFNNTQNIAHGFPNIPTQGGSAGDNYLAPFMADLSFDGYGNPGTCYYWSNFVDSFVVSFEDVPYWTTAAPGYTDTNSFQVILTNTDSSIKFQYKHVSMFPLPTTFNDLVIGIENIIGNMGFENYLDQTPPNQFAIKYYYPQNPSYQVIDANTSWAINHQNAAIFIQPGDTIYPIMCIKNSGNTNISNPFLASIYIKDKNGIIVYSASDSVHNLAIGDSIVIQMNKAFVPKSLGPHTMISGFLLYTDQNPGNDVRKTEIDVVTQASTNVTLDYAEGSVQDGSLSWNGGGGGAGIYIIPPYYPFTIKKLEYEIVTASGDGFRAQIFDDDGTGNSPGTILFDSLIAGNNINTGAYNTVNLNNSVTINSGGFYMSWIMAGANISLGLSTTLPISNRTFEILNGDWTQYREHALNELRMRAVGAGDCNFNPLLNISGLQPLCNGTDIVLHVVGPPGNIFWNNGTQADSLIVNQPGIYYAIVSTGSGCTDTTNNVQFTLTNPIVPTITHSGQNLYSSTAILYQWYFNGQIIAGATSNPYHPVQTGNYYVETVDVNGCSAVSNTIYIDVTGLDFVTVDSDFNISPVPASDLIHINIDQQLLGSLFQIIEVESGRILLTRKLYQLNTPISVEDLPNGVYLIRLLEKSRSIQKLFMVGR